MTVAKLQSYLDELLADNRKFDAEAVATFKELAQDWLMVSENELIFLAEKVYHEHRNRFVDEATRRDFECFLLQAAKDQVSTTGRLVELCTYLPGLCGLLFELGLGQASQISGDGKVSDADYVEKARQKAANFRGTASIAKIDPQSTGVSEIETALRKVVEAIDGFDFLSRPPQGKAVNEHTILIKPGVNWGALLYPTITSWQSVYAAAKMCFSEADKDKRRAKVRVIVGDESGVEIKLWGGTTRGNFVHTGILHGAVLAGVERAAALEAAGAAGYQGAVDLLESLLEFARAEKWITADPEDVDSAKMIDMAGRAGVRVVPFDEVEPQKIPVPDARHYTEGILVPRIVAEEVTDIINLPKPPGRHWIMGNTGLTGALKNHIGLLNGSRRAPGLHGPYDRYPAMGAGETAESYLEKLKAQGRAIRDDKSREAARKYTLQVIFKWGALAPGLPFHEKITELYLAFADKERFSLTDMRWTMSSLGPDVGDTIDIGAVIAAKDPLSLDVLAGALLKRRYVRIGDFHDALEPGGDTVTEYLYGKTWLKDGMSPFDLMSLVAANSYGIGPIDLQHIDLRGIGNSGFTSKEVEDILRYLK